MPDEAEASPWLELPATPEEKLVPVELWGLIARFALLVGWAMSIPAFTAQVSFF